MNVIANYIFQINYGLLQNKNRTNLETFFGRFFGAVGGIGMGMFPASNFFQSLPFFILATSPRVSTALQRLVIICLCCSFFCAFFCFFLQISDGFEIFLLYRTECFGFVFFIFQLCFFGGLGMRYGTCIIQYFAPGRGQDAV